MHQDYFTHVSEALYDKNGGRLGETGSTAHMFSNSGVIHVEKNKIEEEEIFEVAEATLKINEILLKK